MYQRWIRLYANQEYSVRTWASTIKTADSANTYLWKRNRADGRHAGWRNPDTCAVSRAYFPIQSIPAAFIRAPFHCEYCVHRWNFFLPSFFDSRSHRRSTFFSSSDGYTYTRYFCPPFYTYSEEKRSCVIYYDEFPNGGNETATENQSNDNITDITDLPSIGELSTISLTPI